MSLPLYTVGGGATPPIKVPLLVDGKSLTMELDTGAAVTVVSDKQYKDLSSHISHSRSRRFFSRPTWESSSPWSVMFAFKSSMNSKYRIWC